MTDGIVPVNPLPRILHPVLFLLAFPRNCNVLFNVIKRWSKCLKKCLVSCKDKAVIREGDRQAHRTSGKAVEGGGFGPSSCNTGVQVSPLSPPRQHDCDGGDNAILGGRLRGQCGGMDRGLCLMSPPLSGRLLWSCGLSFAAVWMQPLPCVAQVNAPGCTQLSCVGFRSRHPACSAPGSGLPEVSSLRERAQRVRTQAWRPTDRPTHNTCEAGAAV